MPAARHWKVVLHSTVVLDCDVDAAPEAMVRWVDADDRPLQVVEGKNKVEGLLKLKENEGNLKICGKISNLE